MLMMEPNGRYTKEWLNTGIYLGPLRNIRPTYAGPDGHPIHAGLEPYAGQAFSVTGVLWACSPIPQPMFVARFQDGARGLLTMKETLEGFRGIVVETEYARELSGNAKSVLRLPTAARPAA